VDEPGRYRRLARRLALENRMFEVFFDKIEAPSGEVVEDFLIVRPRAVDRDGTGGVCVLPEIDGKIGLMRGYRHQFDAAVWQAPAGFAEPGEAPAQTALRELREETGLTCDPGDMQPLGTVFPDAGLIEARVAVFVARDCSGSASEGEPHREIGTGVLHFFDRAGLLALITGSETLGGTTLVACFRYLALPRK
jgi:ADP-ribose pyrophosphatase